MMVDPVIHWIAALCLALMWGTAALGKSLAAAEFRRILAAYRLVPASAIKGVAVMLPMLEFALAVALVVPALQWAGAAASCALLLAYALAMVINLIRHREDIDCGCHAGAEQTISWALVLRNLGLAALSLGLFAPQVARPWQVADSLVTLLATAFVCLAWLLVQMIGTTNSLLNGAEQ